MPPPDPVFPIEFRIWLSGAGLAIKGSYRVDEVAALLDIGISTVYRMVERGDLDVVQGSGAGQRMCPTRIPVSSLLSRFQGPAS